ncbi:hypothetical protein SCOR_32930 [Sulfidibacter corallicola]|uniref:Uncharacterized protein n=1 Tax=Sulfidibacter corallicola TaxID=2818388 RepID=A0A8A4TKC5_SULCO|nr:hypothetical protein [Sulfidibacter corallicola]QTD49654.1 hypothetical protein J3U87_29070 [Sulfidibacter corallicola]
MWTSREADDIRQVFRAMIEACDTRARVLRRGEGERLFGPDPDGWDEVGEEPIEIIRTPPIDVTNAIDAKASTFPDSVIQAGDRLEVSGQTYRVQTRVEKDLFGVVTHWELELVEIIET